MVPHTAKGKKGKPPSSVLRIVRVLYVGAKRAPFWVRSAFRLVAQTPHGVVGLPFARNPNPPIPRTHKPNIMRGAHCWNNVSIKNSASYSSSTDHRGTLFHLTCDSQKFSSTAHRGSSSQAQMSTPLFRQPNHPNPHTRPNVATRPAELRRARHEVLRGTAPPHLVLNFETENSQQSAPNPKENSVCGK